MIAPGTDIYKDVVRMISNEIGVPHGVMYATAERMMFELTYKEAAARGGCTVKHVRNLVSEGKIVRIRPGVVERRSVELWFRRG